MNSIIRILARALIRWASTTVLDSAFGEGVRIESGAKVIGSTVDQHVYIGPETRLFGVKIGPYASIGPRVVIGENEHEQTLFSTSDLLLDCLDRRQYDSHKLGATEIGADVWIGCNAFVRKGVQVGVGAIIGAHTVVLKDVPPYAIVVGVPARMVGYRFSPATRARLEQSNWWLMDKARLQAALLERYGHTATAAMRDEDDMLAFLERLAGSGDGAQAC